jgi:uncharacterized protein DUF6597
MLLVMRPRSAALAPLVSSLGHVGGVLAPGRERVLPSAGISLMVNLCEDEFRTYDSPHSLTVQRTGGAILAGPRAQSTVIDTAEQRCLVEVSFEPGGAAAFFGVPLSETRDRLVELEELWGRDGAMLRERLLGAAAPERQLLIVETTLLDHIVAIPGLPRTRSLRWRPLPWTVACRSRR